MLATSMGGTLGSVLFKCTWPVTLVACDFSHDRIGGGVNGRAEMDVVRDGRGRWVAVVSHLHDGHHGALRCLLNGRNVCGCQAGHAKAVHVVQRFERAEVGACGTQKGEELRDLSPGPGI